MSRAPQNRRYVIAISFANDPAEVAAAWLLAAIIASDDDTTHHPRRASRLLQTRDALRDSHATVEGGKRKCGNTRLSSFPPRLANLKRIDEYAGRFFCQIVDCQELLRCSPILQFLRGVA